jgi:membrane-bound serine protease (ClpP class)
VHGSMGSSGLFHPRVSFRSILSGFMVSLIALLFLMPMAVNAAEAQKVYVVHVDGFQEINELSALRVKQGFQRAEADPGAVAVLLVIDTPGGLLDSAFDMTNTIMQSKLHTIAYVEGNAFSAGAFIATAAEKLYMHPAASIGASEPRAIGTTQSADYKTVSAVVGKFRAVAQARMRDPDIAQAMVDRANKIPGQKNELLVLTANDAVAKKYADGNASSVKDAVTQAGITDYTLVDQGLTFSDQVGRVLTTPWVATILLVVGVVALGIEFMKPGVTLPGLIGIVSLGLFFMGNFLVGSAGFLEIGLGLIGVVLLRVEAFAPGHGLFGLSGLVMVGLAIFFAVPSTTLALRYIMVTSVAALVVLAGFIRRISTRGLGKALTLEKTATGFGPAKDLSGLMGQEGEAQTVLRPAGMALFGEARISVVTEGEYIDAGTRVRVIRVDGARVIVRPVE